MQRKYSIQDGGYIQVIYQRTDTSLRSLRQAKGKSINN
jgi:hypothetical protein